jgi:DNA-binding beta-propeller fold protein YncE
VIESWDQWRSILPDVQQVQANHLDPERHIWIATGQGVVQLTRDGKRHVNTLDAEDVPQADPAKPRFPVEHFAWASNGDLYTAGGYQVTRFSKDGKFISAFGRPGTGPGEFGVYGQGLAGAGIHGIVIDSGRNRLYVADRVNSRVQVFDLAGKFIEEWPNMTAPYCIRLTQDGRFLWVGDGYTQRFAKYDALTGRLIPGSTWGTTGVAPGTFWGIHFFSTDSDGNLYVGEDLAYRIQKFTPKPDGVKEQLIGALMP